ncbi:hypothetical protein NPIL_349931, partial [Nephila pilipes]
MLTFWVCESKVCPKSKGDHLAQPAGSATSSDGKDNGGCREASVTH